MHFAKVGMLKGIKVSGCTSALDTFHYILGQLSLFPAFPCATICSAAPNVRFGQASVKKSCSSCNFSRQDGGYSYAELCASCWQGLLPGQRLEEGQCGCFLSRPEEGDRNEGKYLSQLPPLLAHIAGLCRLLKQESLWWRQAQYVACLWDVLNF